jgi:hypothetical protein
MNHVLPVYNSALLAIFCLAGTACLKLSESVMREEHYGCGGVVTNGIKPRYNILTNPIHSRRK